MKFTANQLPSIKDPLRSGFCICRGPTNRSDLEHARHEFQFGKPFNRAKDFRNFNLKHIFGHYRRHWSDILTTHHYHHHHHHHHPIIIFEIIIRLTGSKHRTYKQSEMKNHFKTSLKLKHSKFHPTRLQTTGAGKIQEIILDSYRRLFKFQRRVNYT